MRKKTKRLIGETVIKLGQHAVGKSLIFGMFDPEIPQQLKDEMKQTLQNEHKKY